MPGYCSPVHPCLDKMPHCLPVLLCCVLQLHSYAVHADDGVIPDHIKKYVDRRLAEQQVLANILPPVGSVIPWLPIGLGLPSGWQLCDGAAVEGGVLRGRRTPDINRKGSLDILF